MESRIDSNQGKWILTQWSANADGIQFTRLVDIRRIVFSQMTRCINSIVLAEGNAIATISELFDVFGQRKKLEDLNAKNLMELLAKMEVEGLLLNDPIIYDENFTNANVLKAYEVLCKKSGAPLNISNNTIWAGSKYLLCKGNDEHGNDVITVVTVAMKPSFSNSIMEKTAIVDEMLRVASMHKDIVIDSINSYITILKKGTTLEEILVESDLKDGAE